MLDEWKVFSDGRDSGAEFAIEDSDKKAELVASEVEGVTEKAELFAVVPDGTVGEGLGDGAVDLSEFTLFG